MKTIERLQRWRDSGAITPAEFEAIAAIVQKERFSIFVELNVLLYLGVLSFITGIGWTIQAYLASLGDAAIIAGLTALLAASLYYCFTRASAFSSERVESPTMAFDYVLYIGCLVFASELAYIESRLRLLQDRWDYYVLFSALLYFVFAYRFDNRLVLSLALSTLAAWCGLKIFRFSLDPSGSLRSAAIGYAAFIAASGAWISGRGIKEHFRETYLHVAANVLFIAFLSGVLERRLLWFYFPALLALAIGSVAGGIRFRRFAFVVYGALYGYIGISSEAVRHTSDLIATLMYFLISGVLMVILTGMLARQKGNDG